MFRHSRALAALGILSVANPVHAQGWGLLPDGGWGYTHSLTTSGRFTCLGAAYYLPGGGCTASGNTVTLFTANSSMTVIFTASTQTVVATNMRDLDLVMGTLTKTFAGAPFTLPGFSSQYGSMFSFELLLSSTQPAATSGSMRFEYPANTGTSLPANFGESGRDYAVLFPTPAPSPITYGAIVYNTFVGVNITFDAAPQTITSRVGLVPEPSTFALFTVGILGVTGIGALKRNRRV